jgi:hypothetical protein
MKTRALRLFQRGLAGLGLALWLVGCLPVPEPPRQIVVSLGDKAFDSQDFLAWVDHAYPELESTWLADADMASRMFDRFCEDVRLEALAVHEGIQVGNSEVDDFLNHQLRDRSFKLLEDSQQQFLRSEILRRLRIQRLLRQHILDTIQIDEAELLAHFEAFRHRYQKEPQYCVRQAQFEDQETASAFFSRLKKGKDAFLALAKATPGVTGYELTSCLQLADFPESFQRTIKRLRVGTVSEVIPLQVGQETAYHLLYLEKRIPAVEFTFEEVREQILQERTSLNAQEILAMRQAAFEAETPMRIHFSALPFAYQKVAEGESDSEHKLPESRQTALEEAP